MQEFFMYFHEPLPFHMAYPVTGCIEQEKVIEEEHTRMFSYFSDEIQTLQKRIEYEIDQMEYEGSPIYDEYPDKEWMRRIGQNIRDDWMQEYGVRPEEQIYILVVWEVFRRRAKKRRANLIS